MAQAQLVLAQVASQTRETDTAMAAAREAVKLDPQNAASRKLLTTLLQGDSKFESAFDEAKTCLTAHGDDPTAIRLYVEAAERVNHSDLALTMLDKAAQTYSSRAEVLMAVAEGYSTLNQRDKAVRAADKARQCVAETVAARLAVVRALQMLDRMPEAEKMLSDEIAKESTRADLHYQMGQICAATGRMLPAIDQLRQAVEWIRNNVGYHVSLAKALLDSGDLAARGRRWRASIPPTRRRTSCGGRSSSSGPEGGRRTIAGQAQSTERSALAVAMQYLDNQQPRRACSTAWTNWPSTPKTRTFAWAVLDGPTSRWARRSRASPKWSRCSRRHPTGSRRTWRPASILSRDRNVEQVIERMSHIPGARIDMINLAIGRMVAAMGDYDRAAVYLRKVAQRQELPEHVRGRASLLLAQSLFLAATPTRRWTKTTAWLPARPGRKRLSSERRRCWRRRGGAGPLRRLWRTCGIWRAKRTRPMPRAWPTSTRSNKDYDQALSVCDDLAAAASVMRGPIASACRPRKPRQARPGHRLFRESHRAPAAQFPALYLMIEQILNSQGKFVEALAELEKLEANGPSAAVIARFHRGHLFASWDFRTRPPSASPNWVTSARAETRRSSSRSGGRSCAGAV